jgi:hypothetical protein
MVMNGETAMSLYERCMVIGLLVTLLGACDAKSDLAEVCAAFSSLEQQPQLQGMGHAERMSFVNDRVLPSLSRFSKVTPFWELLLNYDAEARYRMFKRGADELVGRWDCPEMERLAPTLTELAARPE